MGIKNDGSSENLIIKSFLIYKETILHGQLQMMSRLQFSEAVDHGSGGAEAAT